MILFSTVVPLLLNAPGSRAVMIKDNWTTETADFQECQTAEHDIHQPVLGATLYKNPSPTWVVVLVNSKTTRFLWVNSI